MGDQSARFRVLFESALQVYEKQTGIALAEHPLTLQVQSYRSVGSITTLLQDQMPASSAFGGNDRVMTSIKSTIYLLSTLSTTAAFDWAIDMVRRPEVSTCSTSLTFFQTLSPENSFHAGLAILLAVCAFPHSLRAHPVTSRYIRRPRGETPATMCSRT
jgi:hypothetical protein